MSSDLYTDLRSQPFNRQVYAALADCLSLSYTPHLASINSRLAEWGDGGAGVVIWGGVPNQQHVIWAAGNTVLLLLHGISIAGDGVSAFLGSGLVPTRSGPGAILRFTDDVLATNGCDVLDSAIVARAAGLGLSSVNLILAGHSHGGSIALGFFTQRELPLPGVIAGAKIVSYGMPRVLSPEASKSLDVSHDRLFSIDDFVPTVCPTTWVFPWPILLPASTETINFEHHGNGFAMDPYGAIGNTGNADPGSSNSMLNYLLTGGSFLYDRTPHLAETYRDRLLSSLSFVMPTTSSASNSLLFSGVQTMAVYKTTYFFQQGGYGWSESYYQEKADAATALADAADPAYVSARMACCGLNATVGEIIPQIQAVRVSNVDFVRDNAIKYLQNVALTANGLSADIPNTCILVKMKSTVAGNVYLRSLFMRGIPDDIVLNGGKYNPTGAFTTALNQWFSSLVLHGLGGYLPDAAPQPVRNVSITQTGADITVVTAVAHGLVTGDLVNITRVKPRKAMHGTFFVTGIDATSYKILTKTLGATITEFGSSRKISYMRVPFQSYYVNKATHRITGGPFDRPVGRRKRIA